MSRKRPDSPLAMLTLLPSYPAPLAGHRYSHPTERRIDRSTLLDVAPDRESLILGNHSIEELRRILKIRVGPSTGHWLYRNHNTNTNTLGAAARMSTFLKGASYGIDDGKMSTNSLRQLRRISSASSITPFSRSNPMLSFKNGFLVAADKDLSVDFLGIPLLSTTEKLISPRPLGPTHVILIHASSASPTSTASTIPPRRIKNSTIGIPKVVELPINDLLFLLNVPNLSPHVPALPRRIHKELPRVVMHVPHLETFPELVVYLHTMNQAELFRAIIPEWIRDLMHPLPSLAINASNIVKEKSPRCKPWRFLRMLACGFRSHPATYVTLPSISDQEPRRTINSIAKEISEISALTADESGNDPVLQAACLLDALRDNLDYVGYYGKTLWNELDVCREILLRAISWRAKIDNYEQKERL